MNDQISIAVVVVCGNTTRLTVQGRIVCCEGSGRLRAEIEQRCWESSGRTIVVDLASGTILGAAGIGVLASGYVKANSAGLQLRVENASSFVRETLRICRLDQFLLPGGTAPDQSGESASAGWGAVK